MANWNGKGSNYPSSIVLIVGFEPILFWPIETKKCNENNLLSKA